MSRAGWFDSVAVPSAWFDVSASEPGWFDESTLDPATGGSASGSLAWTEDNDVVAITGTAAAGVVSGAVAWTEANDAFAISGSVIASGSASWVESDDVTAISGTAAAAGVSGSAAWTEADDVTAIAGSVISSGAVGWTESDDVTAISGSVAWSSGGSIAWTESDDVTAIDGNVVTSASGSIDWTDDNDIYALTGRAPDEQTFNVYGLRAQFKRQESEEQKRIRREAQGIIKKIKKLDPEEPDDDLLKDAENISQQIQEVIAKLEANAKELATMKATKAQEKALRALLIDAQIEHELMVRQRRDLDVAFVAIMLAELI